MDRLAARAARCLQTVAASLWLLPAIAAVATVSAVAAISATPATTAAASASATAVPAATAAAAAALGLRPSFVYDQVPSAKVLPVEGVDRAIRFFVVVNFNESEPARLPSKAIANQIHCRGTYACLREKIV
jgi:hypothetical protein